jgi:FF domain
MQDALVPMGNTDPSSSTSASQPNHLNGADGTVGLHTGGLPFALTSILPAQPNLPDDLVIPHNGFATVEEGEKAFTHLLRKAGVDAIWTWDQTMRAIIMDPLYKALVTMNRSGRRITVKKNRKKSGSHLGNASETGARGRVRAQDITVGMMIMMDI